MQLLNITHRDKLNPSKETFMHVLKIGGVVFAATMFFATGTFAQDSAKQDMKDAGHHTKVAAKDTGHATKVAAKHTAHETKKVTKKTATGTRNVGRRAEDKPPVPNNPQ